MKKMVVFTLTLLVLSTIGLQTTPAQVTLEHGDWVFSVSFSPDGTTLASGSRDSTVKLWDVATHTNIATLEGHRGDVNSVSFSPDGTLLASGSYDNTVKLWDVAETKLPRPSKVVKISGDAQQGWFGVPLPKPLVVEVRDQYDNLFPDAPVIFTVTAGHGQLSGQTTIKNIKTDADGKASITFTLGQTPINTIDVFLVGRGFTGNSTVQFNINMPISSYYIATLKGHQWPVSSVSFSPDGTLLASGSTDTTVKLWAVKNHTNIATLEGHHWETTSLAFSPDGALLASGSNDDTVKLWDVKNHTHIPTLEGAPEGHTDSVTSVSFSPDGTLLASGSNDDTVKLWDMSSFITSATPPETLKGDVNGDGTVDIQDLVLVASNYGQTGENVADVNGDGVVHIYDIILIAAELNTNAAAPALHPQDLSLLTPVDVKKWLSEAQQLELTDATSLRGILFLEQLLTALTPKETILLPNYPNPFNPETWIPYRLAEDAFVTLTIYDSMGQVVRTLDIGHQTAAFYESRAKVIYWDGRNELGEQVATGVYFYHLSAGRSGLSDPHRRDFSATRKMLILK